MRVRKEVLVVVVGVVEMESAGESAETWGLGRGVGATINHVNPLQVHGARKGN